MKITVYGTTDCAGCTTLKNLLDRSHIQYDYKDIMDDENAEEVQRHRIRSLPTTVVENGSDLEVLSGPNTFNAIVSLCKGQ